MYLHVSKFNLHFSLCWTLHLIKWNYRDKENGCFSSVLRSDRKSLKNVCMIREYNNHKLQTNPWYREEEPHNNHETPRGQTKQIIQLSLSHNVNVKETR